MTAGREIYVAPGGKLEAAGTREAPLDIGTVFTKAGVVQPGDTVWIGGGRYEVGSLSQNREVRGTKERPIVFRAVPGERATVVGQIQLYGSYTWLWGLEITGEPQDAVNLRGGDGIRLINLILHDHATPLKPGKPKHPTGQGIGGWDVGDDHEYYGNIIYRNGTNSLDHGIYSQNTAAHTTKRYIDNIVFDNAGYGFHIYGQAPTLHGFYLEGNISFMTRTGSEILTGGSKPISDVVLKGNCTYHAERGGSSKRGVDVGYVARGNRAIRIEDNYFMGGGDFALTVRGIADNLTVRNNTFWSPGGIVDLGFAPDAPQQQIDWDRNRYIANGQFDLDAWRQRTGLDRNSQIVPGKDSRPTGLHVFRRVNCYEPERVHLAVYNWEHRPSVPIDVSDLAEPGTRYRIVNVLDYFGKPAAEGKVAGKTITLPMEEHDYEPEFGAYVLFREVPAGEQSKRP